CGRVGRTTCRRYGRSVARDASGAAHTLPLPAAEPKQWLREGGQVNRRRRIQPKAAVELEAVSLRLPAQLLRAVDQYAKFLGGSTDRTHVITQAIEIALSQDPDFQKSIAAKPAPPATGPVRATA